MTWSLSASGHHSSNDWKNEEYNILQKAVDAVTADTSTIVSSFSFNGNHVSASSLDDARAKIEAHKETPE
jgi:hypothetical protein